jgi:hypothetical protein
MNPRIIAAISNGFQCMRPQYALRPAKEDDMRESRLQPMIRSKVHLADPIRRRLARI